MAFNISEFKSNGLVWGGARATLFDVAFSAPPSIGIPPTALEKAKYTCKAAELPSSKLGTIEVPYFGRKTKIAGDRTFDDWQVTMYNDEDFATRAMFEAWSNAINRHVSNVRDTSIMSESSQGGLPSYKADLNVAQYGKDGTLLRAYVLYGAFPADIGAIALDWESTNQVETFPVTFAYDYWLPDVNYENRARDAIATPYSNRAQQPRNIGV